MEGYNNLCETCQKDCKQSRAAIIIECPYYTNNGKRYIEPLNPFKSNRRELTTKAKTDMKKLVGLCANYDKQERQCLPLECTCYMLNKAFTGALCRWFEGAVLPLHPKLESTLKGEIANTKPCAICGKQFTLAGRKTYCSSACSEKARKHADKLRARKYRRNKRETVTD